MWTERVVERIVASSTPILLEGDDAWGVSFALEALGSRTRLAWVALDASAENDYVAQGNALAGAINKAVGARLLPMALPYAANLQLFMQQRDIVEPLTIALQDARWAPDLAVSLAALHDDRIKVVLATALPNGIPGLNDMARIAKGELALTPAEAVELLAPEVEGAAAARLWRRSKGRYPELLRLRALHGGVPIPTLPAADGARVDRRDALLAEPDEVIDALVRARDWLRAVELAALSRPTRLPQLLPRGGPAYQRLGLLKRLHLLLETAAGDRARSPERMSDEDVEVVLAWRFLAAFSVGRDDELRPVVEAWLEHHEAPELRARYAGTLPDLARAAAEARRAAAARPTPLTLFQHGRLHADAEEGAALLLRAVDMAEREDADYAVVRNAGALAERLAHAGRFREAVTWGAWALAEYDKRDIQDGKRRLRLFNNWAYASVLTGRSLGLDAPLRELVSALEGTLPSLAASLRATRAAFELSRGGAAGAEAAVALARSNLPTVQRRHHGRFALELVRALLEVGEEAEAQSLGAAAAELGRGDEPYYRGMGVTAHGVALARSDPQRAAPLLAEAMAITALPAETRCMAALYWLAATGNAPSELPATVAAFFEDLDKSGLRALSGPEPAFHDVWGQLLGEGARLELRFFGAPEARLDGVPVNLTPAGAEVVLLLSEHPEGLSEQQLHARLFEDGEGARPVTLRVRVARLRERLPVSAAPYRLEVPYDTDLARLRERLRQGDVPGAVELYRGPLLGASDAGGVRSLRHATEELLRQAVLQCGSVDELLKLAGVLVDDLTLWEAAEERLPPDDPRAIFVRAQVRRLSVEYG